MGRQYTNTLATLALMGAMLGDATSLYGGGGLQRAKSRPTVHKCSECPEFHRGCPIRNGELKPCSKYKL